MNFFTSAARIAAFPILIQGLVHGSEAEEGALPEGRAYVTVVNCCETDMDERWRASLDVKFKDQWLARDLRIGERSAHRPLEMDGQGEVEIFLHGSGERLARLPARFEPDSSSSIILTGRISSNRQNVEALVLEDYPVPSSKVRSGQARLQIVNTINSYPVQISFGESRPQPLAANSTSEIYIPAGDTEVGLWFPFRNSGTRKTVSGLVAENGASYTLAIYASDARPDRPSLYASNPATDRRELEILEEAVRAAMNNDDEETRPAEPQQN